MYDKIDSYIQNPEVIAHFEENTDEFFRSNPSFVKIGDRDSHKYLLMNGKSHANQHGLTVEIIRKTYGENVAPSMLHIAGSLRKWKYGALSMKDLTKLDTLSALNRLADELDMPYGMFASLSLSAVEVGLTTDCGEIKPIDIFGRISSFKDARYSPGNWDYDYKRYSSGSLAAKVYDKVAETKKSMKDIRAYHGKERFLKEYGDKNEMRIEYKAWGGSSKVEKYFGIKTFGDLVDNYNSVAAQWMRYTRLFGFKGIDLEPFKPQNNKAKEFTDYLKYKGLFSMNDEEVAAILKSFTGDSRKYVNDLIKELRGGMPDAIEIKGDMKRIAGHHFIEQIRNSQRQWIDENGDDLLLTLL